MIESPRTLTFNPSATRFLASSPPTSTPHRPSAALFGAPLDLTETFRSGTHGGPMAVRVMSDALESYSPVLDRDLDDLAVWDLGDLSLAGASMDDALSAISQAAAKAARLAPLAVMLGGEHTASLAGFRGIRKVYESAVILQADAHLDMREQYDGTRLSHATWLHHAGQEFGFENVLQVGLRSGTREEWRASRRSVAWSSTELVLSPGVREWLKDRPIYVTVDIDVLDPAHAPGTGCPEPGGATFRELAQFLWSLADLKVVGLDVMEVSPNLDASNITAAAAAKIVREGILMWGTAQ